MCGRFVVSYTYDELVAMLDSNIEHIVTEEIQNLPNYNVAPTMNIPVLIKKSSNIHLQSIKWGYKPYTNFENSIINIRSETMYEKKIFRENVKKHRCIIVASGFYEWRKSDFHKQPYYIKPSKDQLMLFAGIYAVNQKKANEITCAIITMKANSKIGTIHDRMPVTLDVSEINQWLDKGEYLGSLIEEDMITMYPVSDKVNNINNNNKHNLNEVEAPPTLFTI